jgi:aminopeptidase N
MKVVNRYFCVSLLLLCFSANAQVQFPDIDVQHYVFRIGLSDQSDTIKGDATIQVKFTRDVSTFSLNLVRPGKDGKGMRISKITDEEGKSLAFSQDNDFFSVNTSAKKGSDHFYEVTYSGIPADGLIISTNKFGHRTFFGDNCPNRAHNWLPCADYPADKATVDFIVTAPDHYQVVANGLKTEEKELTNHLKLTHWKENAPLPTKVMVIGVADFAVDHTGDIGTIPVYTYVFPENKDNGFKSYQNVWPLCL